MHALLVNHDLTILGHYFDFNILSWSFFYSILILKDAVVATVVMSLSDKVMYCIVLYCIIIVFFFSSIFLIYFCLLITEEVQDTVFVSGLPEDATEAQIAEYFGSIGVIKVWKIFMDLFDWSIFKQFNYSYYFFN